jgi:hypothetical protein
MLDEDKFDKFLQQKHLSADDGNLNGIKTDTFNL